MKHKKLGRWHLPDWTCPSCGGRYVVRMKTDPSRAYCAQRGCARKDERLALDEEHWNHDPSDLDPPKQERQVGSIGDPCGRCGGDMVYAQSAGDRLYQRCQYC